RDVVEDGQRIEQIDDLEAARDAGADALINPGEGYVRALEQDAAAVRREMAADQIDERGLAGAVGAHQREKFALVDGEIHAIAGVNVAELFAQVDGLKKNHTRTFRFVIPGRAEGVSPESITRACEYGFRPSPLSRLGRHDDTGCMQGLTQIS